ncbi:hypothetical protein N7519_001261 [Penicillium mononematosum]|uniref:uncharacterized protein n=1 Tax=Penicillium mononematosum TaxID=268346 RepID=UPI0025485FE8|nr:uncharacterized protein N7519_001261 [Penicillium mononematosum]KAJ6191240.1 hypothetical protein N7519_001261 [Penicillium mononematosum]
MALHAGVAGAAGAGRGGRGGRGGRSVRGETRTCWFCKQVGHLQGDCHVRQLIQCRRTCFNTPSHRRLPGHRAAARADARPATIATAKPATTTLRFPPSLLAQAHAILAEPRERISRRNVRSTLYIPYYPSFLMTILRVDAMTSATCYYALSRFIWVPRAVHVWSNWL